MRFHYQLLLVIGLFLIFSLGPFILLFYLGYQNIATWNTNGVKTICFVVGHVFRQISCYDIYSNVIKKRDIDLCTSAEIQVTYDHNYHSTIPIIDGIPSYVESYLNLKHPISSNHTCWYQLYNIPDVRLSLRNPTPFLVSSFAMIILGVLSVVAWSSLSLFNYYRRPQYFVLN